MLKMTSLMASVAVAMTMAGWTSAALGAADMNEAQLFVQSSSAGGTGPNDQTVQQAGAITLTGSATGGANSSGDGTTSVNYGVAKMSGEFFGTGNSEARSFYNDSITITAPGIAMGTPGTLTFVIAASGTLNSLAGGSAASYQLTAGISGGASDLSVSGMRYSPELDSGEYQGTALGTFTATASFQYGFATPLEVELQGTAQTSLTTQDLTNGITPEANFNLTEYWMGMSSFTAAGVAVTNPTVTSVSGTNWTVSQANLLVGDANEDGKVDLTDLNIVLNHLGSTDSLRADGNFDGATTIDLTDLNDVLNNLGTKISSGAVQVPEPGMFGIAAFSGFAMMCHRRRSLTV